MALNKHLNRVSKITSITEDCQVKNVALSIAKDDNRIHSLCERHKSCLVTEENLDILLQCENVAQRRGWDRGMQARIIKSQGHITRSKSIGVNQIFIDNS